MNKLVIISALVALAMASEEQEQKGIKREADADADHPAFSFGFSPTPKPYGAVVAGGPVTSIFGDPAPAPVVPVLHHPAHGVTQVVAHPEPYAPPPIVHPAPYSPAPVHHPAPYSPTPAPYAPAPHHPVHHGPPHHGPVHHAPHHHAPLHHAPVHHAAPYHAPHPKPEEPYHLPKCAEGNTKTWCLEDEEYPKYEIQKAIEYHYEAVRQIYKDVLVNTDNSVDRLKELIQETYLCPSETAYIQPLRAVNTAGKWRIIVNNVKAHYEDLTQSVRIEECTTSGSACPLVPECYETKCLQKSIYHRFLVFDAYDHYLPFAVESFKLPSACACYNGAYAEPEN